jgi:diacylglycerol kinase family enzyme
MFECCDLDIKLTEYRGHAKNLIQTIDLSLYTSIIAVGGDGLIHEIVNGMLQDSQKKFKLPIGVISSGSGNALAQYVCSKISKKLTPENCAYIALKGQAEDFDITKICYETGKVIYSFLSLSWGFIADVDIESDVFRCCGVIRYDLYAVWRLLVLRRYTGMLMWDGEESGRHEGNFVYFWSCNIPYVAEDMKVAPLAHENDGFNDLLIVGNVSKLALCRLLLTQASGKHISNPNLKHFKSTSWTLKPDTGIFSIDGDEYPIGHISAQVLHSIGSFTML